MRDQFGDAERRAGRGRSPASRSSSPACRSATSGRSSPTTPACSATTYVRQGNIQARYWPLLAFSRGLGARACSTRCCCGGWGPSARPGRRLPGAVQHASAFPPSSRSSPSTWCSWAWPAPAASWSLINTETELDENTGRRQPAASRGESTFEDVSFGYNGAARAARTSAFSARARRDGGHRGADRLGQDHADPAGQPHLRRRHRAGCWWMAWTCATGTWRSLRSQISTIEQDVVPVLPHICGQHRLRLPRREPGRRSSEAARQAQAHEFITGFPRRLRHGGGRARA